MFCQLQSYLAIGAYIGLTTGEKSGTLSEIQISQLRIVHIEGKRFSCTERDIKHLIKKQGEIRRLESGLSEKVLPDTSHIGGIV